MSKRTIGSREAWLWLLTALFFVIQVSAYVRFTLEEAFQVYLHVFGLPGLALYKPASLLLSIGAYFWLGLLFPHLLRVPLLAVTTGSYEGSGSDRWRFLITLNGLLAVSVIWIFLSGGGPDQGWPRLAWLLSVIFLVLFVIGCLAFGSWTNPFPPRTALQREGPAADLCQIICKVSIWSNCLFLLAVAYYRPYLDSAHCRSIGVKMALIGTMVGLFFGKLNRERFVYLLGLLVSILGGVRFGLPAARLTSLLLVFILQLAEHRELRLPLIRTWAFGLGQGLGRFIGAPLGYFFIGLEGGPIGAAFGEALAALICTRYVEAVNPERVLT